MFSANRDEKWEYQTAESDLWQVNVQTAELTQLTDLPGSEFSSTLSADGNKLAFLHRGNETIPYQNTKLRILDLTSKQQQELLSDFDRSVESPQWINNQNLVIQYADQGLVKLAQVNLKNQLKAGVSALGGVSVSRPYLSGSYSIARETGQIAYTHGTSYRPAEVALLKSATDTKARVLTQLNDDVLATKQLGQVHEITYASSYDGTPIHAWYITPPDYDATKNIPCYWKYMVAHT